MSCLGLGTMIYAQVQAISLLRLRSKLLEPLATYPTLARSPGRTLEAAMVAAVR